MTNVDMVVLSAHQASQTSLVYYWAEPFLARHHEIVTRHAHLTSMCLQFIPGTQEVLDLNNNLGILINDTQANKIVFEHHIRDQIQTRDKYKDFCLHYMVKLLCI